MFQAGSLKKSAMRLRIKRSGIYVALAAFLLLAAVSAKARAACPDRSAQTIPFTTIAAGLHSAIREPERFVIWTGEGWERLWGRHTAGMDSQPSRPRVDFSSGIVVAMFRGKTQGALPIEIQKIVKRGDGLVVLFREPSPPSQAPLGIGAATYPFQIVSVKHRSVSIQFEQIPDRCPAGQKC